MIYHNEAVINEKEK